MKVNTSLKLMMVMALGFVCEGYRDIGSLYTLEQETEKKAATQEDITASDQKQKGGMVKSIATQEDITASDQKQKGGMVKSIVADMNARKPQTPVMPAAGTKVAPPVVPGAKPAPAAPTPPPAPKKATPPAAPGAKKTPPPAAPDAKKTPPAQPRTGA